MHLKRSLAGASVYVTLLIAAPAAFAQTAAEPGYSAPAGSVQAQLGHNEPRASSGAGNDDTGSLPFSGLDLGLVGGAGGMLLAIGLAVRRLVGSERP